MAVSCKVDEVTRDGPRPQVRSCPAVGASGLVFSCPASHGPLANPLESQARPPAARAGGLFPFFGGRSPTHSRAVQWEIGFGGWWQPMKKVRT